VKSHPTLRRRPGGRAHSAFVGAVPPDVYAGLERIKRLEQQAASTPTNSRRHRELAAAIRIEAVVYRKSLDAEQAVAMQRSKRRSAAGGDR
jgi:hypothetical protein